jgi:hypothetical protein
VTQLLKDLYLGVTVHVLAETGVLILILQEVVNAVAILQMQSIVGSMRGWSRLFLPVLKIAINAIPKMVALNAFKDIDFPI